MSLYPCGPDDVCVEVGGSGGFSVYFGLSDERDTNNI